jgi:hypothetical protein
VRYRTSGPPRKNLQFTCRFSSMPFDLPVEGKGNEARWLKSRAGLFRRAKAAFRNGKRAAP